jgi:hypothetical protein
VGEAEAAAYALATLETGPGASEGLDETGNGGPLLPDLKKIWKKNSSFVSK